MIFAGCRNFSKNRIDPEYLRRQANPFHTGSLGMIRLCPNCNTERPLTEFFCEGALKDHNCGMGSIVGRRYRARAAASSTRPSEPLCRTPTCRNGHPNTPGDLICSICGEILDEAAPPATQPEPGPEPEPESAPVETIVDGWRLHDRIVSSSAVRERFISVRETDGRRGVLTLYAAGSEPDGAIYDLLRRLPRDHVPEIIATGRWCDRAYEVVEEFPNGALSDLPLDVSDRTAIEKLVRQLAEAVHTLTEAGLRHRDLRPPAYSFVPAIPSISS